MPEKPKFRKGMKVKKVFFGTEGYKEEGENVVERVEDGVVYTVECENGITFDAETGKERENFFPGMHMEIFPFEKPSRKKSRR